MRLFAALRPPAAVLDHLRTALLTVGAGTRAVRWTATENWHLTLAFYGSVPDGAVPEVEADVGEVTRRHEALGLRLRGAGEFAHRTLWVGAAGDLAGLAALTGELVAVGAERLGRHDDRVRSRPHLTVARVPPAVRSRRGRRDAAAPGLDALVRSLAVYEGPPWRAEEVLLVESRPGAGRGGGPLYTDVGRYPLGPGTGPVAPWAP